MALSLTRTWSWTLAEGMVHDERTEHLKWDWLRGTTLTCASVRVCIGIAGRINVDSSRWRRRWCSTMLRLRIERISHPRIPSLRLLMSPPPELVKIERRHDRPQQLRNVDGRVAIRTSARLVGIGIWVTGSRERVDVDVVLRMRLREWIRLWLLLLRRLRLGLALCGSSWLLLTMPERQESVKEGCERRRKVSSRCSPSRRREDTWSGTSTTRLRLWLGSCSYAGSSRTHCRRRRRVRLSLTKVRVVTLSKITHEVT